MQLLGIGGVAQEFTQTCRLRAGRPQGMQHLLLVQVKQPAYGDCRGERAGSAGGMKNLVVRSAQEFAYAYADLVAGHRGGQQVFARASQRLRHGDSRREDHGGRMKHRSVRSEEHTSELQSLMRISYAVFCLKKKKNK